MVRKWIVSLLTFCLVFVSVSHTEVLADFPFLQITGNPYSTPGGPYLTLRGLAGQGACAVALNGTMGGTWAVEGLYQGTQNWTPALTVVSPDGQNPSASITAQGSYAFNCADMIAVRLDGTSGTGTPLTLLAAGGGVNRVLSNGVNGGRTIVAGNSPITVTNAGNTATVSCPTCSTSSPPPPVSVQAGSNVVVATPSPGVFVVSAITPSPAPTLTPGNGIAIASNVVSNTGVISILPGANVAVATSSPGIYTISAVTPSPAPTDMPISVNAGTGIAVATPSAGVFNVSNTGVLSVTGSGFIASSGGQNPNITFTGTLPIGNGGTGSSSQNFVDLTNPQTVGGVKTFSSPPVMSGASITSATIPNASLVTTPVTSVTASGPIVSSGGTTPNITCPTCGTGSGTVTSVTGTANQISVATGTTTPVISIATNPTLPGNTTVSHLFSSTQVAGCVGLINTAEFVTGQQCVSSVTGSGSIASSGGATPNITISNSPTFTGTTTSGKVNLSNTNAVDGGVLVNGQCLSVFPSAVIDSTKYTCQTSTNATFVIPNVGSTVSVTPITTLNVWEAFTPITITDGTNEITGYVNTTITGSSTFTFFETAIIQGAAGNTMATNASISLGGQTVTIAGTSNQITATNSGATTTLSLNNPTTATAPTIQSFLSGSGTYTTPAGVKWIEIKAVGAGGGGGASGTAGGSGGTGGNTTFGTSLIVANGGVGAADNATNGGVGGTASLGSGPIGVALTGGTGNPDVLGVLATGGNGGSSCLGGAGGGSGGSASGSAGLAGVANTGGGGGGGSSSSVGNLFAGAGGGSGGCVLANINAPAATYAYAVGAAGTAGTAGTGGAAGGSGGSGIIEVVEHYNY